MLNMKLHLKMLIKRTQKNSKIKPFLPFDRKNLTHSQRFQFYKNTIFIEHNDGNSRYYIEIFEIVTNIKNMHSIMANQIS